MRPVDHLPVISMRVFCSGVLNRAFVTVVSVAFLTQGCGTAILASSWGVLPESLSVGSTRGQVEAKVGKLVHSRFSSDGNRVETYDYRAYKASEWGTFSGGLDLGGGQAIAAAAMIYLVVDALAITPYALYKLATHPRNQLQIAFGLDSRVVWIGTPPAYGPFDDAVEAPSIGAIRRRCWAQDGKEPSDRPVSGGENPRPSEGSYVRCVSRGFAIWGIE